MTRDTLLDLAKRAEAGSGEPKACAACGKSIVRHPHDSYAAWMARRFCCHPCSLKSQRSVLERFEALYEPEPMSGCWLWLGALNEHGYGTFRESASGPPIKAHRMSWQIERGPIPVEADVLHSCDVRCCVSPDHLFLGDNDANVADRVAKGRTRQGETHPRAKLRTADVLAALADQRPYQVIADEYGVGVGQIHNLKNGRMWNSVTGLPKVGRFLLDHLRQRRLSRSFGGDQ